MELRYNSSLSCAKATRHCPSIPSRGPVSTWPPSKFQCAPRSPFGHLTSIVWPQSANWVNTGIPDPFKLNFDVARKQKDRPCRPVPSPAEGCGLPTMKKYWSSPTARMPKCNLKFERMGGACKNYPKLIRVGQSQSVCSDLNSNSNRIDWRSFCKLWRQWTSCSMTVLLGTRAGLHVEVLHKANRLVALRLWVPLESSACFVCHAFPCAKMCQTTEAFWAFAFFIYNASPYCIEHETSILQAAHQQQLQVHFLSGILKHWQITSLNIFDRPKIFRFKKCKYHIISIQLLASQAESRMLLYCSPILGPSDKYKYKWHQVISSDVSRTNRFWWIHDSHAPVAIAVFQLLPESSLPQITHCGRAPWLLHAF